MGRYGTVIFLWVFMCGLLPSFLFSQTEGTCEFTVRTVRTFEDFDPKHVLAVWVADARNRFVRTLLRRAQKREEYLYTWRSVSGGNVVDAVTGATLTSHQLHQVTWDCRDTHGQVVPDGEYRIRVEYTSKHAQGPITPADYVHFTKGPDPVSVTFPDLAYFKDMSLTYTPDIETYLVVPRGSTWKYNDSGGELHGSSWELPSYGDGTWPSGPAPLGYGDSPRTTLSYGGDPNNKYITYYFRLHFTLDFLPEAAKLLIRRDDGIVVYLNGTEIVRDNMPQGQLTNTTRAESSVGGSEETTFFTFPFDPSHFVLGENLLACEVHQSSPSSSDLTFDLELKTSPPTEVPVTFKRGDANQDGGIDIADAIATLGYLFGAGRTPACLSACDANDDGKVDISDPISLLGYLFGEKPGLAPPFADCGPDETPDDLTCESFDPCSP